MATPSWLVAVLAGGLGAVAGGVLSRAWLDLTQPNRTDVGAAWLVAIMVVVGGVLGLLIGWLVTRQGELSPARALGWSCGPPLVATALALALVWWRADGVPTLEGRALVLDIELRAPASLPLGPGPDCGAGLSVGGRVIDYQAVDQDQVVQRDGHWRMDARVPLRTVSNAKRLFANVGGAGSLDFALPLRGRPQREDLSWSDWLLPAGATDAGAAWQARYRVSFAEHDGRPAP